MEIITVKSEVEGHVSRYVPSAPETWNEIVSLNGNYVVEEYGHVVFMSSTDDNLWRELSRGIITFCVSGVNTAAVVGAKVRLYGKPSYDGLDIEPDVNIYLADAKYNDKLDADDFSNVYNTPLSTTIQYSGWLANDWNDFELDANFVSVIKESDFVSFAIRNHSYDVLRVSPSWKSLNHSTIVWATDYTDGQQYVPQLVLTSYFSITTTNLPQGLLDTNYEAYLEAAGGVEPYSWALFDGELPNGLSLHSDGVISGTATEIGTFNFTVKATDSELKEATMTLTINIVGETGVVEVSKVKTPIISVEIIKHDDKPAVDPVGTRFHPEVISCDTSYGFDQGSASCTIRLKTPMIGGHYVIFEPMNRVVVKQGWDKTSELKTTFFGFIDKVEMTNPPRETVLECRDILKLAENNYLINSNRRVYHVDVAEDEPDPNNPGQFLGGQPVEARQAQRIIRDLLTDSGIPSNRLVLDFLEYPAEGAIIIGNHAKAVFVYESVLDAVNRICDLIGYRLWSDENGCIQCREVRPIASQTAAMAYHSQIEALQPNGTWIVINQGNLLSVEANVDDDLRNWIEVISAHDDNVSATVAGPSNYITSPPDYRRAEIRSFLLDTHELARAVAERVYEDLNRLRYTASATIEGDSRMAIGRTVEIYDPFATVTPVRYFVYDYSSDFSSGNWTMTLGLTGGSGPGSLPISNISPVPMFTYRVEKEELDSGVVLIEVFVDASDSYDPDGPDENLTYAWYCDGFDVAYGITNSYVTTTFVPFLAVTLVVTDQGVPPLSSSITINVPTSPAHGLVEVRAFYVASGTRVHVSEDGGKTWIETELY